MGRVVFIYPLSFLLKCRNRLNVGFLLKEFYHNCLFLFLAFIDVYKPKWKN